MNYTKVTVYLNSGVEKELNYVTSVPSPDDEIRFVGQHYSTKFTFIKRNVSYLEMVK